MPSDLPSPLQKADSRPISTSPQHPTPSSLKLTSRFVNRSAPESKNSSSQMMSPLKTFRPLTPSPTSQPSHLHPPIPQMMPSVFYALAFGSQDSIFGFPQHPLGAPTPLHSQIGNPSASLVAFLCGGWMSDPTPSLPRPGSNPTPSVPPKVATSAKRLCPASVASVTSTATYVSWARAIPPLNKSGNAQPRAEWLWEK